MKHSTEPQLFFAHHRASKKFDKQNQLVRERKQPWVLTLNTFAECVKASAALNKQFTDPQTHLTGVRETFDWMILVIFGKTALSSICLSALFSCELQNAAPD